MEHQIRTALKVLTSNQTVGLGEFSMKRIGERTIAVLLAGGLMIESSSFSGRLFAVTERGIEMAKQPAPLKPPMRKPLKTIKPGLRALDSMERLRK